MQELQPGPIETWAMQSKWRAFVFLLGLGLAISGGLAGVVATLSGVVLPDLVGQAAAGPG